MKFPSFFADAKEPFSTADFVIIGVPYEDAEPSYREGVQCAPDAIRQASWNFETYNILNGIDLEDVKIHDFGNVDNLSEFQKLVKKVITAGKTPIIMGGSHSITPLAVSLVHTHVPHLGVVVLDAHLDYRDTYMDTPQSHACATRRISEIVGVDQVVLLGIRSACKEELQDAQRQGLSYYTSFDVTRKGIKSFLQKHDFSHIYLSIDMDSLDPSHAPGVGTPEPFGLSDRDLLDVLTFLAPKVVALDVVEMCPAYDIGITALVAAKFIREYITWKQKG